MTPHTPRDEAFPDGTARFSHNQPSDLRTAELPPVGVLTELALRAASTDARVVDPRDIDQGRIEGVPHLTETVGSTAGRLVAATAPLHQTAPPRRETIGEAPHATYARTIGTNLREARQSRLG
ncbi:MAG: hypothetical protein WAW62_00660 [Candidatus Saccharimonas aalborgensis]